MKTRVRHKSFVTVCILKQYWLFTIYIAIHNFYTLSNYPPLVWLYCISFAYSQFTAPENRKLLSQKALSDVRQDSEYASKKNCRWIILLIYICLLHFQTVTISNKIPCPLQSLLQLQSIVLQIFFKDNTSSIAHLYGCIMVKHWVTEHSRFMKRFVWFTMKNIHPFNVSSIDMLQPSNKRDILTLQCLMLQNDYTHFEVSGYFSSLLL